MKEKQVEGSGSACGGMFVVGVPSCGPTGRSQQPLMPSLLVGGGMGMGSFFLMKSSC